VGRRSEISVTMPVIERIEIGKMSNEKKQAYYTAGSHKKSSIGNFQAVFCLCVKTTLCVKTYIPV